MLTSLAWAEEAARTKNSRGFFGCQTRGPGSRISLLNQLNRSDRFERTYNYDADSHHSSTHRLQRVWQLRSLLRRIAGAYLRSVDNLRQRDRNDCADCRLLWND